MPNKPKAILFDIGGVCVKSPMQAVLNYEKEHSLPPGYINHTISSTSPNGSWQRIERGEVPLNDEWFTSFRAELEDPVRWKAYLDKTSGGVGTIGGAVPKVPCIDAKEMFWNMMRMARSPDPFVYPALRILGERGGFVVAALSNTIAFPEGIRDEKGDLFLSGLRKGEIDKLGSVDGVGRKGNGDRIVGGEDERSDIRALFDVFVSSAHVGMRKPERRIYELALEEVRRIGREKGLGHIQPEDVVFVDDIGSNLKAAKQVGMRTIKVSLGKSRDAVMELERVTGMKLLGGSADEKSKL